MLWHMLISAQACYVRTDFLRIGSVKRMDRAVLPFSLHCESSKSSAVGELKEMLKTAASPAETAIIQCVPCCRQHKDEAASTLVCLECPRRGILFAVRVGASAGVLLSINRHSINNQYCIASLTYNCCADYAGKSSRQHWQEQRRSGGTA